MTKKQFFKIAAVCKANLNSAPTTDARAAIEQAVVGLGKGAIVGRRRGVMDSVGAACGG
jgi:hypothetical protein